MYALFAQVSFNPTLDGLPGGTAIQRMIDTRMHEALTGGVGVKLGVNSPPEGPSEG